VAFDELKPGLIVNADDFGVHPATNAGILSAFRNGIVTSVSLMVTMRSLDETCRILNAAGLPAGLHFCLTQGRAVAAHGSVSDLVDEAGNFRHSALRLLLMGRRADDRSKLLRQIRDEFSAQLALARDHGIDLTHVDSHQHIHMNGDIFSIIEEIAPRFGVHRIRWTREPAWPLFMAAGLGQAIQRTNHIKWLLLRWLARKISPRLSTTDAFFGVVHSGTISKPVLTKLLHGLSPDRSNEICIHPGFPPPAEPGAAESAAASERFTTSPFRQIEHDALVDPEVTDIIRRRKLRLMSFGGAMKEPT
jgi:chitin disaccharide deacetylase